MGAAYHPALQIHLTAMVTKDGEEHRAHKSTFDPFFSRSAISNLSAFIGTTMDQVLDEIAADAEANDGAFDFREDFAFNFPIRVTCEILGLPPDDAEMVRDLNASRNALSRHRRRYVPADPRRWWASDSRVPGLP